jgi:hypothetical protein
LYIQTKEEWINNDLSQATLFFNVRNKKRDPATLSTGFSNTKGRNSIDNYRILLYNKYIGIETVFCLPESALPA